MGDKLESTICLGFLGTIWAGFSTVGGIAVYDVGRHIYYWINKTSAPDFDKAGLILLVGARVGTLAEGIVGYLTSHT